MVKKETKTTTKSFSPAKEKAPEPKPSVRGRTFKVMTDRVSGHKKGK